MHYLRSTQAHDVISSGCLGVQLIIQGDKTAFAHLNRLSSCPALDPAIKVLSAQVLRKCRLVRTVLCNIKLMPISHRSTGFSCVQSVEEDLESASGQNYQQEFLRCLREVNVDNNTVGWYQSSTLGAYQTQEMIETFISYHDSIKKCVCIVYDPQKSQRGQVSLRAIRLKESFIDLFKEQKLTGAQNLDPASYTILLLGH